MPVIQKEFRKGTHNDLLLVVCRYAQSDEHNEPYKEGDFSHRPVTKKGSKPIVITVPKN
jgi:hypothetical protein